MKGHVSAVIEDDGKGFEHTSFDKNRLGLIGMRERIALVGGTFVLETAEGEGTTVIVRIPLPELRERVSNA